MFPDFAGFEIQESASHFKVLNENFTDGIGNGTGKKGKCGDTHVASNPGTSDKPISL